MPLPAPKKGEQRDEFISRCVSDETMKKEYPEQKQRLAVCYSQWRKKADIDSEAFFKEIKKINNDIIAESKKDKYKTE